MYGLRLAPLVCAVAITTPIDRANADAMDQAVWLAELVFPDLRPEVGVNGFIDLTLSWPLLLGAGTWGGGEGERKRRPGMFVPFVEPQYALRAGAFRLLAGMQLGVGVASDGDVWVRVEGGAVFGGDGSGGFAGLGLMLVDSGSTSIFTLGPVLRCVITDRGVRFDITIDIQFIPR